MVDLAFLLITFFMLTTSLSKPVAMDIAKPIVDPETRLELPASRTMTILLGRNNQLAWYLGEPGKGLPKVEGYGTAPAIDDEHFSEAELAFLAKNNL